MVNSANHEKRFTLCSITSRLTIGESLGRHAVVVICICVLPFCFKICGPFIYLY